MSTTQGKLVEILYFQKAVLSKSFSNARVHAQSFQGRVTCSLVLVLQEEEKLKDKPISNHIIRQHIEVKHYFQKNKAQQTSLTEYKQKEEV